MADTPLSGTRLCIAPRHVTSFTCRAASCPLADGGPVPPRCPALRDLHLSSLYERSLMLVCPHAAAQVLFFRGKFHFEMNSIPTGSLRPANRDVPTLDEPLPELSYILDLQRTCLRILETQKYTIDVRLILLGLYLEDAVDFISDGHGYDLGKIIKSYESPLFAARFDAALRNVKFDPLKHLDFLWGIVRTLASAPGAPLDREDFAQTASAFHLDAPAPDLAQIARAWPVCRRSLEGYVLLPHEKLLENFLLHQFYTELYPCAVPGGLIHNYWIFVLGYKVFELLLTGRAAIGRQSFNDAELAAFAARAARLLQTPAGLHAIETALAPREEDSLGLFNLLFHSLK